MPAGIETTVPAVSRRCALGLLGAAALTGSFALAGCDGAGSSDDTPGTPVSSDEGSGGSTVEPAARFTMGINVDPDGLDPQRTAAAATFQITNNVYDSLLRVTPQGELVPALAESWEVAPDGLSVAFTLREGLVFSNGNPCDAAACVASFERLQSEESPRCSEYAGYTFEALDERTLNVTSAELNVAMLTDFAYAWAAVVDVTVADTLANKPVGTGPYLVESWVPQTSVTLKANPAYWGTAPKTETVMLRVLPDATSRASSLKAGDISLYWGSTDQVALFEGNTAYQVIEQLENGVQLMAMNCANEALSDERVRRAINQAVDKDELIEAVWWGYGRKIGSHFSASAKEYIDCSETYAYDPDAARKLLEEAGYADGLTLKMRLPESYPEYVNAGQVIADALKKVGVTCAIEIVDWSTWLSDVYVGRNYDLTVVGHTGRLDPITLLARYGSTSSENYFNYANDRVDELIALYRTELDEDVRAGYVEELQRILAEDVPALYIQTPVMVYFAAAKLHGFVRYPIDIYELKDVWVEA